ncbi:MAG: PAS domain S-box protein [Chloroflexi bacterium]|nr:PAS domain S-box protein [Chloroflexota bacterium]
MSDSANSLKALQHENAALRRRITDLEQVEAALRESEARFRSYFELPLAGRAITSPDKGWLDVNAALCDLLGYTRAELMQTTWNDLTHPDDLAADLAQFTRVLAGEIDGYTLEKRFIRKDGQLIHAELAIHCLRQSDGAVDYFVALLQDITGRKQLENTLRDSEARFRAIVEQATDGIVLADEQGTVIEWNHALEQVTGIPRAEALGQPVWDVQGRLMLAARRDPSAVTFFKNSLLASLTTGQSPYFNAPSEVQIETASGEVRTISQSNFPIKTANGYRLSGVIHDITDRKRIEQQLERRASQMATINDIGRQITAALAVDDVLERAAHLMHERLGYHHVGIFVFNGDHTGLVLRGRAGKFTHLFAANHRLSIGQGIVGWVAKHGQRLLANDVQAEPRYVNAYGEALPTRSELAVPIVIVGEVWGVLDAQSPQLNAFDDNDVLVTETLADQIAVALENARLYEAAQHEIAERRQVEELLHELNATLEQRVADRTAELQAANAALAAANARLTELDRLKDEFLSRISHELRTPLTGILIALELLETSKPEKRERHMQRLKHSADRLHAMIEDILMFSQLNRYTDPATLQPIALNPWLESRLATWQALSADRGLVLRPNLARDVPPVRADSALVMQALSRVVTNAINYTSTGSVTISTVRCDADGHAWATVSVTDTGPGITPEDLPHIFERFYRGSAAADYKTSGAGIGLSISREIVERLGGRLTVETELGVGSTFTLWLPVA